MTSEKAQFPLPNEGIHSKNGRATATCFCGAVQLEFPTEGDGLVDTFVCNCTDCRKVTASMFASNFIVADKYLSHVRGKEKLTRYAQSKTIESGCEMANSFCSICGTLMYRVSSGFPGNSILRVGTVDDFELHETKLKPRIEQYTKNRVAWLSDVGGAKQVDGSFFVPNSKA